MVRSKRFEVHYDIAFAWRLMKLQQIIKLENMGIKRFDHLCRLWCIVEVGLYIYSVRDAL